MVVWLHGFMVLLFYCLGVRHFKVFGRHNRIFRLQMEMGVCHHSMLFSDNHLMQYPTNYRLSKTNALTGFPNLIWTKQKML
jgi:hypothetical protein